MYRIICISWLFNLSQHKYECPKRVAFRFQVLKHNFSNKLYNTLYCELFSSVVFSYSRYTYNVLHTRCNKPCKPVVHFFSFAILTQFNNNILYYYLLFYHIYITTTRAYVLIYYNLFFRRQARDGNSFTYGDTIFLTLGNITCFDLAGLTPLVSRLANYFVCRTR